MKKQELRNLRRKNWKSLKFSFEKQDGSLNREAIEKAAADALAFSNAAHEFLNEHNSALEVRFQDALKFWDWSNAINALAQLQVDPDYNIAPLREKLDKALKAAVTKSTRHEVRKTLLLVHDQRNVTGYDILATITLTDNQGNTVASVDESENPIGMGLYFNLKKEGFPYTLTKSMPKVANLPAVSVDSVLHWSDVNK